MTCGWLALAACTLTREDFDPDVLAAEERPDGSTGAAGGAPSSPANPIPSAPESGTAAAGAPGATGNAGGPPLNAPPRDGNTAEPGGGGTPSVPLADAGLDAGTAPVEPPLVAGPDLARLVGWASVEGLGVDGTTGGALGAVVVAESAEQLIELAARPEALTIGIDGTLDVARLEVASNKTLVGMAADATLRGGIAIRGAATDFVSNVIVSNLNVEAATSDADGDAIQIHYAHHVWIDHVALSDAPDGLLDIVHGSDFITISNSRFFYTAAAPDPLHRFTNQTGHDDENALEDRGHLNVTWHHDFWDAGVSKALSSRYGQGHAFNNLFRSPGNENVIVAGLESSWRVESNHFEDVAAPFAIVAESGASVVAPINFFVRTSGARDTAGSAFVPPYAYTPDTLFGLEGRIVVGAGPR